MPSSQWGRLSYLNKNMPDGMFLLCAPTGIRTPVVALKGLRPSPLDDGGKHSLSGRILSSHPLGVKHFELFFFLHALAQQGEHLHFFPVKKYGRTFHF
jgi:hypothetical protein